MASGTSKYGQSTSSEHELATCSQMVLAGEQERTRAAALWASFKDDMQTDERQTDHVRIDEPAASNYNHPTPFIVNNNDIDEVTLLNSAQRSVLLKCKQYFADVVSSSDQRPPQPLHLLVHGGPGTGKSFLTKCIDSVARTAGLKIGCMAPTGIAASNLPAGRTIHNFCGFPLIRKMDHYVTKPNNQKLASIQCRAGTNTLALVIIDEISNMGPELLGQVEKRLRDMMDNDRPFGGLSVLLMGDFFQLPPVIPGETLYSAVLKQQVHCLNLDPRNVFNGPRTNGARLFASFQLVEFTEQMLAAYDTFHMSMLDQLRSPTTNQPRITCELLSELRVITSRDVQSDPAWTNATIVVTSNEERFKINELLSIFKSRSIKTPRIVWYRPILGIVANQLSQQETSYIYQANPQFKGCFVAGAPGFLLDNINPVRSLSNGTPVTYESIVLHPEENLNRVLALMMDPTNQDIILERPPQYINVRTKGDDPVTVPLPENKTVKPQKVFLPGRNQKVDLHTRTHGVDLAFAITAHKVQGQTCDRLIVDLNPRPFSPQFNFHAFYVAISRVRRGDHLRIMPLQPSVDNLNYLLKLKPSQISNFGLTLLTTAAVFGLHLPTIQLQITRKRNNRNTAEKEYDLRDHPVRIQPT